MSDLNLSVILVSGQELGSIHAQRSWTGEQLKTAVQELLGTGRPLFSLLNGDVQILDEGTLASVLFSEGTPLVAVIRSSGPEAGVYVASICDPSSMSLCMSRAAGIRRCVLEVKSTGRYTLQDERCLKFGSVAADGFSADGPHPFELQLVLTDTVVIPQIWVSGATGFGSKINGVYRQNGRHNGKPLYKMFSDGQIRNHGYAIIYFDGFWKLNFRDRRDEWCYALKKGTSPEPLEGIWKACGNLAGTLSSAFAAIRGSYENGTEPSVQAGTTTEGPVFLCDPDAKAQGRFPMKRLAPSAPLPEGWEEAYDTAGGRTYFYNRATRVTQWTPPKSDSVVNGGQWTLEEVDAYRNHLRPP